MHEQKELNSKTLLKEVELDSVELLYGNSLAGIFITLFASSGLVFGFEQTINITFKVSWWLLLCLVLVLRMADLMWWNFKLKNIQYNVQNAKLRFVFGTLTTSLWWCSYCVVVFPQTGPVELASMIIVVAAMAGGAATILAAHKLTAMLYSFILLGPFSIGLLLSSEQYRIVLGALGLGFCLVMVFTAKKSALFTRNAVYLKNQNAVLVNEMEEQVALRTAKIVELSNLDPLTGLYNRTAFTEALVACIRKSEQDNQQIALLFIDLDGFKKINDTLGHDIGDKVLTQTAARLKNMRLDHNLLCRWGGDEFLVVMTNTSEEQAIPYAHNLIANISQAYEFTDNRLSLGATVGIAILPKHTNSEHELILLADTAMYFQKKNQPGSVGVFNQELGRQLFREQWLSNGLSEALELGQMHLVYQPIVDANTHDTLVFEALLRWTFEGEAIPPDEFICIAEQHGQIIKIGSWVLQQSCLTVAKWQSDSELSPSISVNVSVLQLLDDDFILIVEHALQTSGLSPDKLYLEITESVFSANKNKMFSQIRALQALGIKVSIDDFGTEYSSLSVIQDLAFNTVKIDKIFVDKLESSGFAIIKAVVQIAKALNCKVVAEGVENQQQATILSQLGVDSLQGYYFAKPMEHADAYAFYQRNVTDRSDLKAINISAVD
jgi:diguanylate cyclase (GGDEF)-like protein